MIDAVEPLSLVLWGVFFLAAGMYPLGFMLGSSCSPCCSGQCGDPPVEFNRCIRFVNTNTSAPPTTYAAGASVDMPLHGYSRAVTRPEQIGARRVPTSLEVSVGAYLDMFAATMSDGETRTATYRVYYFSPDNSSNMDLGTALQWNVTLQGVTRPLVMPASIPSLQSVIYSSGAYSTPQVVEYGVGDARLSASATTSTTVHSVSVASGGQWLDGATVTESSLKAMLTASLIERNSTWVSQLTFNADVAAFQYVPFGSEVALSYVIKHSRGSQHRFATFAVTVFKGDPGSVTAIPSGGLQSVSISQQPYADTLYGVTPPVFSGSNVTIYSDNAVWNGPYQSVTIAFPAVVVNPTGVQLRATEFGTEVNNGQFLSMMGRDGYGRLAGKPLTFGWIMFAFDPGPTSGLTATTNTRNPWNYNTSAVESFLAGDTTTEYIDDYDATWTMQVSDPTQFCGFPLCTRLGWYEGAMYGDAVENTVTVQTAPLPQSTTTSTENGTTTYINRCYGQDSPPVISMRLRPGSCSYSGFHSSCINFSSAIGYNQGGGWYINRQGQGDGVPQTRQREAPARYFYCGDLLWAIENGPCRTSLAIPYQTWGIETYTLGGNNTANWQNNSVCAFSGVDQNGHCHAAEATLSLDDDIRLDAGFSGNFAGKIIKGDYVMQLASYGFLFDTNCNQQVFVLNFPVEPVNQSDFTRLLACLARRRELWCSRWEDDACPLVATSCTYAFNRVSGPQFGQCGVSIGSQGAQWYGLQPFPGSVSFGQPTPPYATSVSPQVTNVGRDGGTVQLAYCCPQRTQSVSVPASSDRYPRTYLVESSAAAGRGATAYVTQAGYDGSECPFDVIWLSGSTGYAAIYLASEFPGRIFSSDSCPIVGQVSHSEQPGCSWSVTASDNWIIASKSADGLLEISIDSGVAAVFAQPVYYNFSERQARRANITITSLGTTKSWTIIQLKP